MMKGIPTSSVRIWCTPSHDPVHFKFLHGYPPNGPKPGFSPDSRFPCGHRKAHTKQWRVGASVVPHDGSVVVEHPRLSGSCENSFLRILHWTLCRKLDSVRSVRIRLALVEFRACASALAIALAPANPLKIHSLHVVAANLPHVEMLH